MRKIAILILPLVVWSLGGSAALAETRRLDDNGQWKALAGAPQERYRQAVAGASGLVDAGDTGAVREAFKRIRDEFADVAGADLKIFAKAEIAFCRNRYARAATSYAKLHKNFPNSEFTQAALGREFIIGTAFLQGRREMVLGFLPMSGYSRGVKVLETVSDVGGLDDPNGPGLKGAIAVAEYYEGRQGYSQAYLKWSEIAAYWDSGEIGKRALLRMAENKWAAYNKEVPERRQLYDASRLVSAKTYYQKFTSRYPKDAEDLGIAQTLHEIDEDLAYKDFTIGQFYRKTHKETAANLYFQMVARDWPNTRAAELAKEALGGGEAPGADDDLEGN